MRIWLGRQKCGWPPRTHREENIEMRMIEPFSRWDSTSGAACADPSRSKESTKVSTILSSHLFEHRVEWLNPNSATGIIWQRNRWRAFVHLVNGLEIRNLAVHPHGV